MEEIMEQIEKDIQLLMDNSRFDGDLWYNEVARKQIKISWNCSVC